MNKIYILIISGIAGASLLAFNSCSKMQEEDPYDESIVATAQDGLDGEEVTFTLSVPDYAESAEDGTKTFLGTKNGSSYPVKWSANDPGRITLNGSAPIASNKDSDTQITATFKPASGLNVYNFLYRGDEGHDNQVTIPASQTYYSNDFDDAAMPMYAASAARSNTVTFSHLCSLLKFSITGNKKIDSVTLTAVDGSKSLSGTFTIGKTGAGLLNGTLTPAAGGGSVNFNFPGHLQLSGTASVFYIAIPAGTYEGGIDVQILDNDQGHMNFKVLKDNTTITAGRVRELETFAYEQVKDPTLKQIWNATTFQEFVTAVAGGEKNLNARLTPSAASIDLSGISFNSISDYQGTFDGNGKTLSGLTKPMFNDLKGVVKNLTLNSTISITDAADYNLGIFARQVVPSSESDDIAGLQNCTAQGSITYSPSSALGANPSIGGMVGNNRGGAFINCTNEATVTFADNGSVTHTGDRQPSIGGVVGRSQKGGDLNTHGNISNCSNSGTVSCAEQFEGNIMIGGVIGYGVEAAESISGCSNSGLVKAASTCTTTKVLHIGGVAGMFKGTVESCSNLTAGTVTTESGSAAGTYLCQGGVFGRLNNGSETYSGISNAGTVNVAAVGGNTLRLIGGVVGRCNEGATLTECTNSGNINYTASDANKTYIGGVVASNTTSGNTLEGCQSTGGTLSYSGATTGADLCVGGVVGYSNRSITNCSNAMTISATGTMARDNNNYICFGGVAGYVTGANNIVTNCTNSGAINYGQTVTGNGQTYVGGLVGAVTKSEISGGGNSGTFTFSGQNTAKPFSIGGIVGRVFSNDTESGYTLSNNVTNSGAIVLNSTVSGSQYAYVGGLIGQHLQGNIYGTNNASITVTEIHESMMALGGIVGYLASGTVSNGTNTANGDIALNGFVSGYHSYVGGIVGMASGGSSITAGGGTITGASNAGDITIGSGCTIPRNNYVGGVIGYAGNTVSGASNTGNVVNNYSQSSSSNASTYFFSIAGVAGKSAAALSNCYNTGNVTNNGTTYKSEINIGGVVGHCEGDLTSCSNGTTSLAGGTISNTATSGTNSKNDLQVGGVAANNRGYTFTSCFNKGAVTNSGDGAVLSIGGIAAWSNAGSSYASACYNTGAISNSGASNITTANQKWDVTDKYGVRMGGIVGCAKDANTFAGTSGTYNYNNGSITESSSTKYVAVAGICGWANNVSSGFAYCRNNADGDILIENNERINVVVGGILGIAADASIQVSYTRNAGTIEFKELSFPDSGANQGIFAGGILGVNSVSYEGEGSFTITHCSNRGNIQNNTRSWNSPDLLTNYSGIGYSYVGGIVGGGDKTGYKYEYCYSRGDIYIYSNLKMRVGGIAGYSNIAPEHCGAYSDVYYMRQYNNASYGANVGAINTSGAGDLGGIVGYCNTSGPFNDLTFYGGTLISRASYPAPYGGGIVGEVKTSCTFSGCNVAGTISGSGKNSAGLFCGPNGSITVTFSSCNVKSKTKHVGASTQECTSNDHLTLARVFGTGNSGNTTSSATMSGSPVIGTVNNPWPSDADPLDSL